ncbi:MAG: hypothetical protein BGO49_28135 [Planctomycetales bacterium 71-10]|nr:MAG: hypothetical protein BGO49_28135 [Planctomycetales bacterium 71-10]
MTTDQYVSQLQAEMIRQGNGDDIHAIIKATETVNARLAEQRHRMAQQWEDYIEGRLTREDVLRLGWTEQEVDEVDAEQAHIARERMLSREGVGL